MQDLIEKTMNINGRHVAYAIHHPKKQRTIVAIHGFRGTHHGLQFIAEHLPEYRIIIPDLPGFGGSEPLQASHTIENYIAFINTFITNLNLSQSPILLGHSFGSILASHYAAQHADMIKQLILINPIAQKTASPYSLGYFAARSYYKLGELLPQTLGTKMLQSALITDMMSFLLAKSKNTEIKQRIYFQHRQYFGKFHNRKALLETFQISTTSSVEEISHHISLPTLLIVGENDAIAPFKSQAKIQLKIKNATLQSIPNVGHLIHYETPEIAGRYIKDFLQ